MTGLGSIARFSGSGSNKIDRTRRPVRYHSVRDSYEGNATRTTSLPTSEMTADIMTKSLPRETHWKRVDGMGMVRWAAGEAYGKRMALGPMN